MIELKVALFQSERKRGQEEIGRIWGWVADPERNRLRGLLQEDHDSYLLPIGFVAALACCDIPVRLVAPLRAREMVRSFVFAGRTWRPYQLREQYASVPNTFVRDVKAAADQIGLSIVGPAQRSGICLIADHPEVDGDTLGRVFDNCIVTPVSFETIAVLSSR